MDPTELASRIDHTVLGPKTTIDDVKSTVNEAVEYGMNVSVPNCYISDVYQYAPDVPIVAPVGFPQGQQTTEIKRQEAIRAVEDGASEVDMVINVGWLKSGRSDDIESEIATITDAVSVPVKVIIEAPILTIEEKHAACQAARSAGADFVKTSTGFVEGGATVEDVELMSEYLPAKASGGVGSWEKAKAMFDAGAERIGASSGRKIVEEFISN